MKTLICGLVGLLFLTSYAISCPQELRVRERVRRQPVRRVVEVVTPPYRQRATIVREVQAECVQQERVILRYIAPSCSCNGN